METEQDSPDDIVMVEVNLRSQPIENGRIWGPGQRFQTTRKRAATLPVKIVEVLSRVQPTVEEPTPVQARKGRGGHDRMVRARDGFNRGA